MGMVGMKEVGVDVIWQLKVKQESRGGRGPTHGRRVTRLISHCDEVDGGSWGSAGMVANEIHGHAGRWAAEQGFPGGCWGCWPPLPSVVRLRR
jgi:hypothetical protein